MSVNKPEQTLYVNGFLGLEDITFVVKNFNVVIGPQASGKSVLARLIFFFREYLEDMFSTATEADQHKSSFDKLQKDKFQETFPTYSWENQRFEIKFETGQWRISLFSKKNSSSFEIKTSTKVASDFRSAKIAYKNFLNSQTEEREFPLYASFMEFEKSRRDAGDSIYAGNLKTLFVPAARSFFSTFRDEIFSVLQVDKTVDPIMLNFGRFYEAARKRGGIHRLRKRKNDLLEKYSEGLIKGKYIREDDKDWIVDKDRKIEVRKASSGQQEALPLLLTLSNFSALGDLIIVEEPEAHLFPTAQKEIIEFLATLYSERNRGIFITTHSPYVLSSINNLILAGRLGNFPMVKTAELSAYYLDEGGIRSIVDDDTGLVDADAIDSVSQEIAEEFDRLMDQL